MKIFKNIIIILLPLFILSCFVSYFIEPKFNLWQMDKSIVLKKQALPIRKLFLPAYQDTYLVESGLPRFVLAGPGLTLFGGEYLYKIEIMPMCSGKDLGFMDVTRKNGNAGLGAKEITALKEGEVQVESLSFQTDSAFDLEFRLYSKGECSFEIKKVYLERQKINWRTFLQVIWQKSQSIVR